MRNCPNCGAPIKPYKCKCDHCGTWYFDLTAFDMVENKPCYIKFRTPWGTVTTLARPELQSIESSFETVDMVDSIGRSYCSFLTNKSADMNVVFHMLRSPSNDELYRLDINDAENCV